MKINSLLLVAFGVLIFALNSCFEPGTVNYVEVNPNTTIPEIVLNYQKTGDTIIMEKSQKINFIYDADGKDLIMVTANLDGLECETKINVNNTVTVTLVDSIMNTGTYQLEVTIYTNSKTGSLADKVNAEGFKQSRKFHLIYLKESDFKPVFTEVGPVDGLLKLQWTMGNLKYVKNYTITKKLPNNKSIKLATIEDPNTLWVNDENSVGDSATYLIICQSVFGTNYSSTYDFKSDIPELINVGIPNFGEIRLTWEKCKYWKALKAYRITSELDPIQYIQDYNTNFYHTSNAAIGYNYSFTLTLVPKDKSEDFVDKDMSFSKFIYAGCGEITPLTGGIIGIFSKYIYEKSGYSLNKYDIEKNLIVKKYENLIDATTSSSFSPNGNFYFQAEFSGSKFKFINFDFDNQATEKEFSTYLGHDIVALKSAISDNGILAILDNDSLYIIDLIKDIYIESKAFKQFSKIKISPDGKYLVLQSSSYGTLFKLEDKLVQITWQNGEQLLYIREFEFLADEENKLWYYGENSKAHILKLSSMEEMAYYSFPNESIINFDWVNYRVCLHTGKTYRIIDLKDGKVLKENIKAHGSSQYTYFKLSGNFLYYRNSRIRIF